MLLLLSENRKAFMFFNSFNRNQGSMLAFIIALAFFSFFLFAKLAFKFLSYNFYGVKEMFIEYYKTWKVKKKLKWLLSKGDKQEFIQEMEFHAGVLGINSITWTVPQVERAFRKDMKQFQKRWKCKYASDLASPIQPQIQQLEESYWFFKNEFGF